MTYPSSITTAHKNSNQQYCKCAVGRGYIVSKPRVLVIIYYVLALLVLLSAATHLVAAPVETSLVQFDIPRQSADDSLPAFGQQANITVVYPFEDAAKHYTNRLYGKHSLKEGIYILLKGSGLHAELSADGHLIISSEDIYGDGMMNRKKNILASTIAFFVGMSGVQGVAAQDASDAGASSNNRLLEEVIVTATKRGAGTSIQDTAMAISALTRDNIEKRGLVGMDDYLRTLPGISMQDRGAGQNSIVIRGLSADPQGQSSTTGVYFGEVPLTGLGTSGSLGSAGNADIKLVDVERIEVLRGPQGSLYGADSMGGVVRVLPSKPVLDEVEGAISAKYSQTGERGGDNTMLQGMLNVPLIDDELAVRMVAYQFDNSGFVENVASSQPSPANTVAETSGAVVRDRDDVGNDQYTGFRITSLWQPSENLDISLLHLQQDIEQDGSPEVNLNAAGDYQQNRVNTGPEGSRYESLNNEVDITNLVINYDLGWGSITSATSQLDYAAELDIDFSQLFFSAYYQEAKTDTDNFIQELRLSSSLEGNLQFVVGLYYEDKERSIDNVTFWSGGASLPPPFGASLFPLVSSTTTKQKALFGELSYEINDQVTATVGARQFDYEISGDSSFNGAPIAPLPSADEKGQSYKALLAYTPNEDMLVYGQWSEGFRPGKGLPPNAICAALNIPFPTQLDSDTTENIELGFKSSWADNRFTLNTALYRINWDGIPVNVNRGSSGGASCVVSLNAGKAVSEGVELELQSRVTENIHIDLSASYGESTLSGNSSIGNDGDNLPGSSDFNATLGVQYDFSLVGNSSFARIDYSYVSEYFNSVGSGVGQTPAGGFGQLNLKIGTQFDQLTADIFVDNMTNDDGLTWVESVFSGATGIVRANQVRPRTMGLNLRYQF